MTGTKAFIIDISNTALDFSIETTGEIGNKGEVPMDSKQLIIPNEMIERSIILLRGQKVMLDVLTFHNAGAKGKSPEKIYCKVAKNG